ncbi:MAG: ankyrin repeat domain-containing protein [Cyclobacteriaceae bacterium]|nr:ankyrin repeat domain-containing protein [Cyclobacteriaceae bacterium]
MKYTLFIIYIIIVGACTNRDKVVDLDELNGYDYRLFQKTPIWELAKAAEDKNIEKIRYLINKQNLDKDFREPKYGQTLLMVTVNNENIVSTKALLELGADPNLHDSYDGSSAIIDAVTLSGIKAEPIEMLNLLIQYGADPNDIEVGPRLDGNTTRDTPILAAASESITLVKRLVELGADVNYTDEFGRTPMKEALFQDNYDIVLYLLEQGTDYTILLIDRSKYNKEGNKMYITDLLREKMLPLDSEQYKCKMKIVEFLKEKGIDYKAVPIPDFVIKKAKEKYVDNWQEYLDKY